MIKVYSSSIISLIFCGKSEFIFTPFYISLDLKNKYVNIEQKNWFLIGKNQYQNKFTAIRSIELDNMIFGSNLHIKTFGNRFTIYGLKNSDAIEIKEIISSNQ